MIYLYEVKYISLLVLGNRTFGHLLERGFHLVAKLVIICENAEVFDFDHIEAEFLEDVPGL